MYALVCTVALCVLHNDLERNIRFPIPAVEVNPTKAATYEKVLVGTSLHALCMVLGTDYDTTDHDLHWAFGGGRIGRQSMRDEYPDFFWNLSYSTDPYRYVHCSTCDL